MIYGRANSVVPGCWGKIAISRATESRIATRPGQQQKENDYQEQEEGINHPFMPSEGSLECGPKVEPMFPYDQPLL